MSGQNFFRLRESLVEKTLTAAEKRKREEVAKAIEREHPGMNKAKKMAIATATAKRVAEDAVSDYMAKGGKVTKLPYKMPRKAEKTDYSSKHIGGKGEHKSGKAANTTSPKPVGEDIEDHSDPLSEEEYDRIRDMYGKGAARSMMNSRWNPQHPQFHGKKHSAPSAPSSSDKHYHKVPFAKKDEAKKEGMRWDSTAKKWYHTSSSASSSSKFQKEEVEQVNELKKSTLVSYTGKVVDPVYGMPRTTKKLKQRLAGLQRAHQRATGKKPTSEEVEINEAKKVQMHKPGWMLRADPALAAKVKKVEDRKKAMNKNMAKYGGKTGEEIAKMSVKEQVTQVDELSTETLAKYKTAAAASAKTADKAGNFALGHKRFKGMLKATGKQFKNIEAGKK